MFRLPTYTVLLVLFLGALRSTAEAQVATPTLTVSKVVDVSADQVWAQLRRMDNIPALSSFVGSLTWTGPKGVGGERRCVAPDEKSFYIERIEAFDDAQRSYAWQVVEGIPAKNVHNRFRVVDLGYHRALLVFTSNYEFVDNPNMTQAQFHAFLRNASSEMLANAAALAKG